MRPDGLDPVLAWFRCVRCLVEWLAAKTTREPYVCPDCERKPMPHDA